MTQNSSRLLSSIGLAKKAGKLVSGTEAVCDAIRRGGIFLVLFASDVSDNTKKRLSDCCRFYGIPLHDSAYPMETLGMAIGKTHAACVGITDEHFSKLIESNLINRIE